MSSDAVESAAPAQSTADIATSVMSEMEATPAVEATADATPIPAEAPAAPAAPTPAEELSAAAKFLVSKGHKWGKRPDGKTDLAWLPATSVANFLDEYTNQHKLTWEGEKNTYTSQLKELQEALNEQRTLITGDPRNYLSQLAQFDNRYAAFLEQQKQEQAATPSMALEPDITLPDGSRTFSMDYFTKTMIPSIIEQARAQAKAEAEGVLKPLRDQQETEKATTALREKTRSMISEAEQWPGFKDHHADILKALQADSEQAKAAGKRPTLTLEAAYRQVVIPKMAADRNSLREELLKELDTAAKATPAVARSGAETTKPQIASTRDTAARVIAQMERGA